MKNILSYSKFFAALVFVFFFLVTAGVAHADQITVMDRTSLDEALASSTVDTILLGADITAASSIVINSPVIIDGQGSYKLVAGFDATDNSNNSVLLILANNVTVRSLTVDGASHNVHGIQAYTVTGITLDTVSVINNGKSGITVNGSEVTVHNITTSNNTWGGINVDKGSGVTSPAVLTVSGVSSHSESTSIWLDDITKVNVSVGGATDQYSVSTTGNLQVYTLNVTNETQLRSAIANPAVSNVKLGSDFTVSSEVIINKPFTIDAQNHKITSAFAYTDNSNNSAIGINSAHDVVVKNLTVDGTGGTGLHGVNIYQSTNVSLDNVTVSNNTKSGVNVNASTVSVNNLKTSNNTWYGVDVDKGTVSLPATLTVNGVSTHSEPSNIAIFIDDTSTTFNTVIDSNNQYDIAATGTQAIYTLKAPVVVPPTPQPTSRSGGHSGNATPAPTGTLAGQVLGAETVNWSNLSDEEKATIISSLNGKLADIIKLFQLLLSNGTLS